MSQTDNKKGGGGQKQNQSFLKMRIGITDTPIMLASVCDFQVRAAEIYYRYMERLNFAMLFSGTTGSMHPNTVSTSRA